MQVERASDAEHGGGARTGYCQAGVAVADRYEGICCVAEGVARTLAWYRAERWV